MPVQQILIQPPANSLNAAYRTILFRVAATDSNNYPTPPVVYCDIYVNGTFFRTLSKSQPVQINDTNSEWQFDVQNLEETFERFLPPHGGFAIQKPENLFIVLFCRFRSSYADDNNIIQPDPEIPVQASSSNVAAPGTGLQSNTFVVVNATLGQEDNPDLQKHLSHYKHGAWSTQAFPLSHRPNNYVLARSDSDYFPFIYTGTKAVTCLALNLQYKDGSSETLLYCEQLPACTIVLNSLRIGRAAEIGDGRIYYTAFFGITDVPDHLQIEISLDGGATWTDITNDSSYHVAMNVNSITYNANAGGTGADHSVRVTPFCDDTRAGTPATASYVQPTCPTVTNLTVTYNPQTQIFSYVFIDPYNQPQSVTLIRNGTINYGVTYNDAPTSGNWTVADSGDYFVQVYTPCSVGDPIIEVSNTITITVVNHLCDAPTNAILNFTPDGKSLRVDWQVADHTYADLVKWYNADNNSLLVMGLVSPNVNFAVISISSYLSVQRFYATIQHQCPSPSVLALSNTVTRDNNFLLQINLSTPGSVYVDCIRYGQPAPAPFTANVLVQISYQIGGTGSIINTQATGQIVVSNTQNYIYGSGDVIITNATILNVSPATQGGFTYIH